MQREVEKGQAPKDVDRVDPAHNPEVPNQQPHVHYGDGTATNQDGTVHDAHKGIPDLTKKVVNWLEKHGWKGN
jgi:hypothetical protein